MEELWINYQIASKIEIVCVEADGLVKNNDSANPQKNNKVRIWRKKSRELLYECSTTKTKQSFT